MASSRLRLRGSVGNWLASHEPLWPRFKLAAPGVAAIFILSVLIVIEPVQTTLGPSFFLCQPILILFVFPSPATVAEHFEHVVLALLGGFVCLAVAFLALCGTVWIDGSGNGPYASDSSRAVGACVLTAIAFADGWVSIALPRFKNALRTGLFLSIFCITDGTSEITWSMVGQYWYPLCVTATVSLLTNVCIFPRTANAAVPIHLKSVMALMAQLVQAATRESAASSPTAAHGKAQGQGKEPVDSTSIWNALSEKLSVLPAIMVHARHELTLSRLPLSRLDDVEAVLAAVECWLFLGLNQGRGDTITDLAVDLSKERAHFSAAEVVEPTIKALAAEIVTSLNLATECVDHLSDSIRRTPKTSDEASSLIRRNVETRRANLSTIARDTRHSLSFSLEHFGSDLVAVSASTTTHETDNREGLRKRLAFERQMQRHGNADVVNVRGGDAFTEALCDSSLFAFSLLQVSVAVGNILKAFDQHLTAFQAQPRPRIWWPTFSWQGWAENTSASTLQSMTHAAPPEPELPDSDITEPFESRDEYLTEISSAEDSKRIFHEEEHMPLPYRILSGRPSNSPSPSRLPILHRRFVRRLRVRASRRLLKLKRSRPLRYASKLTLGIILLSLPAWLPSGRDYWTTQRAAWALVAYFYVLETTTAATILQAIFRFIGTVVGAVLGLASVEITRANPYGFCVLFTIFMAPVAVWLGENRRVSFAIIWGAALGTVAMLSYVAHYDPTDTTHDPPPLIALKRGYEVTIGIAVAMILNLVMWPYHARKECILSTSRAVAQVQKLYTSLARQLLHTYLLPSAETQRRFQEMEDGIDRRLRFCGQLAALMDAEVSLLAKPTGLVKRVLAHLDKMSSLLVALRQCREQGMRRLQTQMVFHVLDERREFISCVSLVLWSISRALETRAPVPQFLPSPSFALEKLSAAMRKELDSGDYFNGQSQSYNSGVSTPSHPLSPPALGRELKSRTSQPALNASRTTSFNSFLVYIFTEHAILSSLSRVLESLLDETRILCGETTFLDLEVLDRPTRSRVPLRHEAPPTHPSTPRPEAPTCSSAPASRSSEPGHGDQGIGASSSRPRSTANTPHLHLPTPPHRSGANTPTPSTTSPGSPPSHQQMHHHHHQGGLDTALLQHTSRRLMSQSLREGREEKEKEKEGGYRKQQ